MGAQVNKALPVEGLTYFEAQVFHHVGNCGGDYLAYTPGKNEDGELWVAIGVASHRWSCESCGWWDDNDGSGWYSPGDVFFFDKEHPVSSEPIDHEDIVGVLIDRTQGRQCVCFRLYGVNVLFFVCMHCV